MLPSGRRFFSRSMEEYKVKNSTSKGGRGLAPLKKTAAFLMLLGVEKAQSIIAAMDNSEIRAVIAEIRNMKELSLEIQEGLWAEFRDLGYEETMNSAEVLAVLRCLFNGGIICR